jgi:poly(ribitol-phosphate) beta-N-acetylglucosaminyltransferase
MQNAPFFSLIIPAYNAEDSILNCMRSLSAQFAADSDLKADGAVGSAQFEIIVVDDASTDSTFSLASEYAACNPQIKVLSLSANAGPGAARNLSVSAAQGRWIVFVDSDDRLVEGALAQLQAAIEKQGEQLDAIGYNWNFVSDTDDKFAKGRRSDQSFLKLPRQDMLRKYLSLRMDGSVIFTAMRRSLLIEHGLTFAQGYHEDVDFLYKVLWHARSVSYLDAVLYRKTARVGSIVNTISERHLHGFVRAWHAIAVFTQKQNSVAWELLRQSYLTGVIAVIATRVREIAGRSSSLSRAGALYQCLYEQLNQYFGEGASQAGILSELDQMLASGSALSHTKYAQVAAQFLHQMRADQHPEQRAQAIGEYLRDIANKSWSCIDLHHSVFLAPDQIRTCCKRFFVDGEMRGDVVLFDVPPAQLNPVTPIRILQAKRELHTKINAAEPNACDACPFLEFKDWGGFEQLTVKYLSFEYHSVCNLKCSYCSDTYYGGKQANYDVNRVLDKLLDTHALDQCGTVVWGGGEPVIGRDFDLMLDKTVERIPNAVQRVLTNAVKHNDTVQRLLEEKKISITTSIDAGTEETYTKVRGIASLLYKAMTHLQQYASADPSQVTVKYIFTEGNYSLAEVQAFIALVHEYQLTQCNFQISCDFTHETIALEAVISMIAMYGMLIDANCPLVFFDDLLRQRLSAVHEESEQEIRSALAQIGLGHILADRHQYQQVAIWGAGWQSKYLLEKSAFFKHVELAYFVDSRPSRIGDSYMGYPILAPDTLLKSDLPVVIAAVQNLPLIYKLFLELGIPESRLIKQLII